MYSVDPRKLICRIHPVVSSCLICVPSSCRQKAFFDCRNIRGVLCSTRLRPVNAKSYPAARRSLESAARSPCRACDPPKRSFLMGGNVELPLHCQYQPTDCSTSRNQQPHPHSHSLSLTLTLIHPLTRTHTHTHTPELSISLCLSSSTS